MSPPPAPDPAAEAPPVGGRVRRLLALAAAALWWERLWQRLWPAACIVGGFAGLALLDVLPQLPDWLHVAVLAFFAIALAAAVVWALPAFRGVARTAARTRLERDSGLVHRPLAALEDRLAAGESDALARALWQRHRETMAAAARNLRVTLPRTEIARHEPWGVRAGVLLLLAVGLAAGWRDPGARLVRALDPGLHMAAGAPLVELWITPPAYTGRPPLFLSSAAPAAPQTAATQTAGTAGTTTAEAAPEAAPPLAVPAGSTLLARATGMSRAPTLLLPGAPVDAIAFAPLSGESDGPHAFRADATVTAGERIVVRGSGVRAEWPLQVIADQPPGVSFTQLPQPAAGGLLAIAWQAADDYGVSELAVRIVPATSNDVGVAADGADGALALRVPLSLNQPGGTKVAGQELRDFADQPLAGQPVRLRLEATDGAGQQGVSEWAETVLPERVFTHPVARALIALRKRLAASAPSFAPPDASTRTAVANELVDLAAAPEKFADDVVVSLALAVAQRRLMLDAGAEAVASVRTLMWETALRLEQGDVPLAERRLEEARQRLMEALQRDAPPGEIERLMDEVQQALDTFLAAAAAELARRGQQAMPFTDGASMLRADDLREMLDMARQIARAGSRDAAMQMLAELQRMLDGIRSGLRAGQPDSAMAEAQALMQTLRDLADRQQALLDDSFQRLREQRDRPERQRDRSGQGRQPNPSPGQSLGQEPGQSPGQMQGQMQGRSPGGQPSAGGGADAQRALRRELGALTMRMNEFLGSIPGPLGEADQSMRGAVDALQQNRLADAVPRQTQASDALGRALDAAGQAMAQRFGKMMSMPGADGEDGGSGSGDIFGRSADGRRGFATGDVPIPDPAAMHRAREILDELRRRAAERSRPAPELEYIDRLLRRF